MPGRARRRGRRARRDARGAGREAVRRPRRTRCSSRCAPGAAVSMPGMMDTILNLGLNDVAVEGLARTTGNPRFARDSYRRLIQMYGEVVDGDRRRTGFEQALDRPEAEARRRAGHRPDRRRPRGAGRDASSAIYRESTGDEFPQDAREQLRRAVRAVFDSWDTPRAQVYRRAHGIPDDLGTAVNVVQMVFGNKGDDCGTGVCFTRDPSTGEQGLYGEFLANAQGEDVVAGIRTPEPLEAMQARLPGGVRAAARDDAAARGALPRHAGHRVHGRGRAGSSCCRRARRSAPRRRRSRRRSTWSTRG